MLHLPLDLQLSPQLKTYSGKTPDRKNNGKKEGQRRKASRLRKGNLCQVGVGVSVKLTQGGGLGYWRQLDFGISIGRKNTHRCSTLTQPSGRKATRNAPWLPSSGREKRGRLFQQGKGSLKIKNSPGEGARGGAHSLPSVRGGVWNRGEDMSPHPRGGLSVRHRHASNHWGKSLGGGYRNFQNSQHGGAKKNQETFD